jgi:hypothetical protein
VKRDRGLEDYEPDDDTSISDYPPQPRYRDGYRVSTRCSYPGALVCPCDGCGEATRQAEEEADARILAKRAAKGTREEP